MRNRLKLTMIKEELAEPACLSSLTERLKIDTVKAYNKIVHKLSGFVSKFDLIIVEIHTLEAKNSQLEAENRRLKSKLEKEVKSSGDRKANKALADLNKLKKLFETKNEAHQKELDTVREDLVSKNAKLDQTLTELENRKKEIAIYEKKHAKVKETEAEILELRKGEITKNIKIRFIFNYKISVKFRGRGRKECDCILEQEGQAF